MMFLPDEVDKVDTREWNVVDGAGVDASIDALNR
jgi:hypothetical protein